MSAHTSHADPPPAAPRPEPAGPQRSAPRTRRAFVPGRPAVWLLLGTFLQLLAVGGRWDVPLAAWLFQTFLLRFLRTTRPWAGIPLVIVVLGGAGLFWAWQLAVPFRPLTIVGVLGLGVVSAVPYALDRLLAPRLGRLGRLLLFPSALATLAFLLGTYNLFGTAYGLLAVTQHDNLALLQVISFTGPYAITFLMGAVATAANHLWEHGRTRQDLSWYRVGPAVTVASAVAVVLVGGQAVLAFAPAATAPTVRIAGINPSAAVLDKADRMLGTAPTDLEAVAGLDPAKVRAAADAINQQLLDDTRQAARAGARIVMWSENSARVRSADEPAFLSRAGALAREEGIYLNVAANVYLPEAPYGRDQTVLFGPDGKVLWTYQKHHPIPGLEDYEAGTGPVPVVDTPYGRLSNVICFDADFPDLMHVDADIMLVPGGDWPEMGRIHTRMAGLRAMENGYALVRSDFNGSSQAFDHQGRVLSQQDTTSGDNPPWISDVPTRGTTTVYRVIGDVFAYLCAAVTLAASAFTVRRPRAATPLPQDGNPA
ncbi:nitrilase-related carbon-nitrogen hydrolase [Streptomyces mayonensis]|uniref:nitrilase-related carbon-nitrogen hydrolase n=1 Tax=Streptomyces mayonensis TaxID=2750816 RepID=UPI001C1DF0BE|nr:nitrilase-related carbon-nitrogen hydrolase [Streptomyces sp. A108]MBU6530427.1 nitrilase [Streptomyces sp. A108]